VSNDLVHIKLTLIASHAPTAKHGQKGVYDLNLLLSKYVTPKLEKDAVPKVEQCTE